MTSIDAKADAAADAPERIDGAAIAELRERLAEAEETLNAIRNGEVDAVVVNGPGGQQVYTLQNADRPYRVLIEEMQEGAVTLSNDGTVLYCNQRFATLVDAPRETIIGGSIVRYFCGNEAHAFTRLLLGGPVASASGEFVLCGVQGSEVPVNISLVDLKVDAGMPRTVCGVVTDLTHNRQRSYELAAANQRLASEIEERRRVEDSLQLALDASGMGHWDVDLVTEVTHRSLRHDRIFGYAQLQGAWTLADVLRHFVAEDRAAVAQAFEAAKNGGTVEFEHRIRRAGDDAIRWLHLKGRTYYQAGVPVRIAGVVADITERRETEEQLRQAQKMEAVGQLTGGIAHDFNNLLMIIGGSLEMLSRRVPIDERTDPLIEAARQGIARGAKLNQQLLSFSRRQDLRAEDVRVDQLVPSFEHLLDRALGEAVTVRLVTTQPSWYCHTDPHQLETAILNLAINARDAMPGGGTLTLTTANRRIDETLATRWGGAAGDYVVVAVADTGFGMPPDIVARVFEPFFTTKAVGKGTGLGLSQVYGFAKQSGGFVVIDSEPGRGTTVSLYLPRIDPLDTPPPANETQPPELAGHGRILVVEDDPDVRATASSLLRELGYQVHEAETGRAALKLLDQGLSVDLVFTDVIMPDGMSGIELAQVLSRSRPELPVLLTSGYTAQRLVPEDLAKDLHLLRKPYALPDLSQAIGTAINSARGALR